MVAASLSVLVSVAFAGVMAQRWAMRRRPHQAAWAIGLAMFGVAAAAGLARQLSGATELEYRLFYLFGAILNVAWLALGTIYLLANAQVARWTMRAIVAFSLIAAIAVFTSPVDISKAVDTGKGFEAAPLVRALAIVGSAGGSVVLVGGALWSAWVFFRRRREPRRALANVIIAVGISVAAIGGTAAFTGTTGIVEWTNFVGVTLLFIGFLLV